MKPLPKWVGLLGTIAAGYAAVEQTGALNLIPASWRVYVAAAGAAVAAFAHSLPGTGGK